MSEEMKRKTIILTFIGALTLLFLVVGGTFAYFQIVNTEKGNTTSALTGATEDLTKYGIPTLTKGSDLKIDLSMSDMSFDKKGTSYWSVASDSSEAYTSNRKDITVSTASIENSTVEDAYLSCSSDLIIKVGGTLVENKLIDKDLGKLYLSFDSTVLDNGNYATFNPSEIDLLDLINGMGENGYKIPVKYTIVGASGVNIKASVELINKEDEQDIEMAGKNITINITNNNLSCSARGPKDKAYATFENLKSDDYYYSIVTASFVDYIPSDLEAENIIKYIDISDTASGTKEENVIAWFEKTDKVDDYSEPLYNLFIGSQSEIYVKDLSVAFSFIDNLKTIDFSNLNTSETTDMSSMFAYYQGTSLDLSSFDTSSVTNMSSMFSNASAIITFPQGFGSAATDMNDMFSDYKGTTLDLSNFDTTNVTDMSSMFYNVSANITFPQGFGSAATDMSSMFYNVSANITFPQGFGSAATDMGYMFSNVSANITFPQGFGSAATVMSGMFSDYKGTTLDLSNFDTTNVTNMSYMFQNSKLTELDLSYFDTSQVTDMNYMFYGCSSLTALDLSGFTFEKVQHSLYIFFNVPATCKVKVKSSQRATFEKFSYKFTPDFVD